jgi:flagellar motor switch/type III secretory pathway protein FliN
MPGSPGLPDANGNAAMPADSATSAHVTEEGLVPSPPTAAMGLAPAASAPVMRLPVELEVAIPLRGFRVRDLLRLASGTVVESQWVHGEDVPLGSADVQLAWSEFEVMDTQLAVRLTRLV